MKLYEIQYIKDLLDSNLEEKRKAYDEAQKQYETFLKSASGRRAYFDLVSVTSDIDKQEMEKQATRIKDTVEKKNRALIDAGEIVKSFRDIDWTMK